MFGLSMREKMADTILNVCGDKLGEYRKALNDLASASDKMTDEEMEHEFECARKEYFNSVFDYIWNFLEDKDQLLGHKIRIALCNPEITGLPPEFTIEHFDRYGVSAGAAYAIFYYASTNKPIRPEKDYKTLSRLNYAQAKATDLILDEIKNSI